MARLEIRAPGSEQVASVDDLSVFRFSAANLVGRVHDAHAERIFSYPQE